MRHLFTWKISDLMAFFFFFPVTATCAALEAGGIWTRVSCKWHGYVDEASWAHSRSSLLWHSHEYAKENPIMQHYGRPRPPPHSAPRIYFLFIFIIDPSLSCSLFFLCPFILFFFLVICFLLNPEPLPCPWVLHHWINKIVTVQQLLQWHHLSHLIIIAALQVMFTV